MTPEQIQALKPGREMDEAIAVALVWKRLNDTQQPSLWEMPDGHQSWLQLWSTDGCDAVLLLDEMTRRGWEWAIRSPDLRAPTERLAVVCDGRFASGDFAAAVSRAFLLASMKQG